MFGINFEQIFCKYNAIFGNYLDRGKSEKETD